jgi:unsaturated rhamnogalacturonyl hydrolase
MSPEKFRKRLQKYPVLVALGVLSVVWAWSRQPPEAPRTATGGIHETSAGAREEQRTLVLLDNYYNSEWRTDSAGVRSRYHYLWRDSANSGYSMLGAIITGLGAELDTLCRRPAAENLERAGIYIIVDPDTPEESDHPMVIDSIAAAAVAAWVRAGGVLVLFGNDRGNADLEHLSLLSSRFGIRFNEDSRNRVVGKNFQTGTFEHFPDHPLFRGLRKIYIKELSTLSLQSPAVPVLTDGNDTIMACAQYGKGTVFAVGDPWFYNEYMDGRKLPAEYDNARAAENLFRWLLQCTR